MRIVRHIDQVVFAVVAVQQLRQAGKPDRPGIGCADQHHIAGGAGAIGVGHVGVEPVSALGRSKTAAAETGWAGRHVHVQFGTLEKGCGGAADLILEPGLLGGVGAGDAGAGAFGRAGWNNRLGLAGADHAAGFGHGILQRELREDHRPDLQYAEHQCEEDRRHKGEFNRGRAADQAVREAVVKPGNARRCCQSSVKPREYPFLYRECRNCVNTMLQFAQQGFKDRSKNIKRRLPRLPMVQNDNRQNETNSSH